MISKYEQDIENLDLQTYWKSYYALSSSYLNYTTRSLSETTYIINSSVLSGTTDNYVINFGENPAEELSQHAREIRKIFQENNRAICIALANIKTQQIDSIYSELAKLNYFNDIDRHIYEEIWLKSEASVENESMDRLENELSEKGYEIFLYIPNKNQRSINELAQDKGFIDDLDLNSYKNAFVEGFKSGDFLPPDSEHYAHQYLTHINDNSFNISVGIRTKDSHQIAACSFLLLGKSPYISDQLAYLHGDTVLKEHNGNGLQKYLIAYRQYIAHKLGIPKANIFSIVESGSASHRNYTFHRRFKNIGPNPITYIY